MYIYKNETAGAPIFTENECEFSKNGIHILRKKTKISTLIIKICVCGESILLIQV